METWNQKRVEELVIGKSSLFVEDNRSKPKKRILRVLHDQTENALGNLVCVIAGEMFDVAVKPLLFIKDSKTVNFIEIKCL